MTRDQQTQLRKNLRAQGYRSSIEQRGLSWRLTVSVSNVKTEFVRQDYVRNEHGRIKRNPDGTYQTVEVVELRQQYQLNLPFLLSHLKTNGWPLVRLLRSSTNEAVFELDHQNNFWKMLADF
jgi:hypothetical protein